MRSSPTARKLAFIMLALLLGTARAQAQDVTLAWDQSPDTTVVGYTVHVGSSPGLYTTDFDVPGRSNTTFTFTQALPGTRYYFAVSAYNAENVSSPYSNEISWKINTAPILTQPADQSSPRGTAVSLQLTATDDGDPLTYSASNLPTGLSINGSTGRISGTATTTQTRTVTVNVTDGQYTSSRTFTWTVYEGITLTALNTDKLSPQLVGTTITFTPTVSGGIAPLSYKYLVFNGSVWTTIRDWSTTATATWTPTVAYSSYNIALWVRNAGFTVDTPQASINKTFAIRSSSTPSALTVTALNTDVPSPQQVGTSITFTPVVSGGTTPYSYKYLVFDGISWMTFRDWSTTATATWTPTQAHAGYNIALWVRNAGNTVDGPQASLNKLFTITSSSGSAPLTVSALNSSVSSPQATGTSITLTGVASGGVAPLSYKFWAFDGTTWSIVRDWNTLATAVWTPTQPANYNLAVWVRGANSTVDSPQGSANRLLTITGTGSGPLSVTTVGTSLPSPQPFGTTITLTPMVSGGAAPYSYKYWVFDGLVWTILRDWSTTASTTWTPTGPGTYNIATWVRNAGVTVDSPQATFNINFIVVGGTAPMAVTALDSSVVGSAPVGTPITLTPSVTGGTAPYSYKYWVFNGTSWTVIRDWSTTASVVWTPTQPNAAYNIALWVRSATSSVDGPEATFNRIFTITP